MGADVRESRRDERLDLRIPAELKALATQAAALSGAPTISAFVTEAIRTAATRTIEEHGRITTTVEGFRQFHQLLNNPPAPNEKMRKAARDLKALGLVHDQRS